MARNNSSTIPAPIKGWNSRDALEDMDPQDALVLVNLFPDSGRIRLRKGFTSHATTLGGAVQTLIEYRGADGAKQLLCGVNGKIRNITTSTDIGVGFSSDKWQTTHFRNSAGTFLFFCNGVNTPQLWNGTTLSAISVTGSPSPAVTTFINCSTFKSRVYFVSVNSTVVSYLKDVNTIGGDILTFDFGGVLKRGGYVMYAGSWTHDRGIGLEDAFVVISSEGEVVLYSGSSPLDWTIQGRFFLPRPIGRRCAVEIDSDLLIITEDGLITLSSVISAGDSKGKYNDLSFKIRTTFRDAAINYRTNFGWEAIQYARGSRLVVNIPLSADGLTAEQYVMNLETGAWCRFTNQNATCWCIHNEELYFGTSLGSIMKADTGYNDNGYEIPFDGATAFNYLKDRSSIKLVTNVRPFIEASAPVTFSLNVNVDFENLPIEGEAVTSVYTGDKWDQGLWNIAKWGVERPYSSEWYAVAGVGRCVSIRLKGNIKDISFSFDAFSIIFERGGFL